MFPYSFMFHTWFDHLSRTSSIYFSFTYGYMFPSYITTFPSNIWVNYFRSNPEPFEIDDSHKNIHKIIYKHEHVAMCHCFSYKNNYTLNVSLTCYYNIKSHVYITLKYKIINSQVVGFINRIFKLICKGIVFLRSDNIYTLA